MSGADEVLELIDTTLTDWAVSADAMRSAPWGSDERAASVLTPERVADAFDVPRQLVVHSNAGPADAVAALRELRDNLPPQSSTVRLAMSRHDVARLQRLFVTHYRAQVNEAREALRPAFEAAQEAVRTAYRQFRGNRWVLCPCPPQEPDPKAWVTFTDQPARRPRAHHRRGPDPRRISVRRAPSRTGRRA
ncbi:hypothetical protein [Nocardiopsis sp. YSL2]|uniref:hypothetical protein n=1 Tax=Nocardiopsis sp. YSL2 TaxID=2939492 RepID=UPI0026F41D56|nr:hypothetical protein [Nocardiopsis sp. YSL2]